MGISANRQTIPQRNSDRETAFQTGALCGNISGHADWDTNPWYKNALTSSRGFGMKWNGNIVANLDPQGWPADDGWLCVLSTDTDGVPGVLPIGTYHCRVESLQPGNPFPITLNNDCYCTNIVLQSDGITWLFDLVIWGLVVIIQGTGGYGMRNLVIPQVGFNLQTVFEGDRFLPSFKSYFRQYNGLRFMDASASNGGSSWDHTLGSWDNRISTSNRQCGFRINTPAGTVSGGIPLEILVELSNAIKSEPGSVYRKHWTNVPHDADDNYVTNYFTYIRDNLDPDIEVYAELSNECWNYMFPQAAYFYSLSQDPVWAAAHTLSFNQTTDANALRFRAYAARAYEIQQIAQAVWDARPGYRRPLKMILAGQYAGPGFYQDMIEYLEGVNSITFRDHFFAIAIAPYFSPDGFTAHTTDAMYNASLTTMDSYPEFGYYDESTSGHYSRTYGLKYLNEIAVVYKTQVVCYEGGWDILSILPNSYADVWTATLLEPRFAGLIEHYLDMQFSCGTTEFYWFYVNPGKWSVNVAINYFITQTSLEIDPPLLGYKNFGNKSVPAPAQINAHNTTPINIGDSNDILMKCFVRQSYTLALSSIESSSGGFYGPYISSNDLMYQSTDSSWDRWIDMATYVPVAGTFTVNLVGSGGTWRNKTVEVAGGTPSTPWGGTSYTTVALGNDGQPLWDQVSDGDVRWILSTSVLSDLNYVDIAEFVPPVAGTATSLSTSRTTATVTLAQGWQTLRIRVHVPNLCHDARTNGNMYGVNITNAGTGYTNPVVVISPPDLAYGIPATAVAYANATTGAIDHIWITYGGAGYANPPTVTITDPTGINFACTPLMNLLDDGYDNVYQLDQYGNKVLDQFGQPIILSRRLKGTAQAIHHLTFTRIA